MTLIPAKIHKAVRKVSRCKQGFVDGCWTCALVEVGGEDLAWDFRLLTDENVRWHKYAGISIPEAQLFLEFVARGLEIGAL